MDKLVKYLETLGFTNVRPAKCTIGREIFEGAYYTDRHGCSVFYMLGDTPKSYRRRRKTVYNFGNCEDWYVACYWNKDCNQKTAFKDKDFSEFHPFGANWQLRAWSVPSGEAIDQYDEHKYTRIEIKPVY